MRGTERCEIECWIVSVVRGESMENRHQRNKDFRLHLVVENGGRRERNTDIVKKKKKNDENILFLDVHCLREEKWRSNTVNPGEVDIYVWSQGKASFMHGEDIPAKR